MPSAEKFAEDKPGFTQGVHLIVLCGWGRGMMAHIPKPGSAWTVLHSPAHDLATIGALNVKLDDLWRIYRQQDRLARSGVQLINMNGSLNFVQYWRDTDHLLVPRFEERSNLPVRVMVATDYVLAARREAYERLGLHAIPLDDDRDIFIRTRRKATSSWFAPSSDLLQFVPMGMAIRGETVGAVLVDGASAIWVTVPKSDGPLDYRVLALDTALSWAERVTKALCTIGKGPRHVIRLTVRLPDQEAFEKYEKAAQAFDEDFSRTIRTSVEELEATVELTAAWFGHWRKKDNVAERLLARKILKVLCEVDGVDLSHSIISALMTKIVPSDAARFQHALHAHSYYDVIQGVDRPEYRGISESAAALAKTGLAWDAVGQNVVGLLEKNEVLPTVRATVRYLLDRVVERGRALDRESLLRLILRRHEGAVIEESQWLISSASARDLAADQDEADAVVRERLWAVTAVRVGSRLLAEVIGAVPSSLDTQAKPEASDVDVDELVADAILALHMGDLHAEIENGVTPPKVGIALSGELVSDQSFGDAVVRPVGIRVASGKIRGGERQYAKRITEPEVVPAVDHMFPASFGGALVAEFGLTFDGVRTVRDELEDLAIKRAQAVLLMRRSDLIAHLVEARQLPEPGVRQFVDRLLMPLRKEWSKPPAGFALNEVEPWRSGRRLGFFSRSFIPLTADADPQLMIAPGAFGLGITWQIGQAYEGGLPESFWFSTEMKNWARQAAADQATAFAKTVGERLRALGLEIYVEVMPSKVLGTKAPAELGDVDVFAIDRAKGCAWIIEVKDLGLCRSQRETALRMADYAGRMKPNGRPDPMLKHLQRVRYIRAHSAVLAKHNRLEDTVKIRGILVVSTPQPMIVVEPSDPDAKVVLLEDLDAMVVG